MQFGGKYVQFQYCFVGQIVNLEKGLFVCLSIE